MSTREGAADEAGRDRSLSGPFAVRHGSPADVPLVLGLFDEAVRWMVARGATEQWGATSFSSDPKRVSAVEAWASGGGLRVCERDGHPVAAMVLGDAPAYVPRATEPELYVVALVASRTTAARGAGRMLLGVAESEARASGAGLLRVDCFAGNGGALISYYEKAGFERASTFLVGTWPGQLLQRRLAPLRA
ncbi:MAG: N-acetyltransferase family protein [Nocardioidaceae bacterium]